MKDLSSPSNDRSQEPLLPRSAWTNQLAYLKVLFRAKKALDLAEQNSDL